MYIGTEYIDLPDADDHSMYNIIYCMNYTVVSQHTYTATLKEHLHVIN